MRGTGAGGGRAVRPNPAPARPSYLNNTSRGFAPSPGRFLHFRLPTGPGLRIDRGVTEGDTVAPEFDPMIAKLIARGADRPEALARLRRALSESAVVLDGGAFAADDGADAGEALADALGQVLGSAAAVERYAVLAGDRGRAFSWMGAAERVWQLHADL